LIQVEAIMADMSKQLLDALRSDESGDLDQIIRMRRQEDLEALLGLLSMDQSVKQEYRMKALYSLGRWANPAAIDPIRRLLPHLQETERVRAIDALGRLGTPAALPSILEYADDESIFVRAFVARALGRIGTPEARAKLREIERSDPADHVRALASKYSSQRQEP
jgi:HEAT repeat protein